MTPLIVWSISIDITFTKLLFLQFLSRSCPLWTSQVVHSIKYKLLIVILSFNNATANCKRYCIHCWPFYGIAQNIKGNCWFSLCWSLLNCLKYLDAFWFACSWPFVLLLGCSKQYWMIFRATDFLAVVWLGSSPTSSLHFPPKVVSLSQSSRVSPGRA